MPQRKSSAAGSADPAKCVTLGGAPSRPVALPVALVIIIVGALIALVALGVPTELAVAGLGGVVGLTLRFIVRMGWTAREVARA